MTPEIRPFALGQKAASTANYDQLVGKVANLDNGDSYRLVKAVTAMTAPAKKIVVFTITAGTVSFAKCKLAVTAGSTAVAGFGDPALSGDVSASEYMWVKRRGTVSTVPAAAGIAAGDYVTSITTTAGKAGKLAIAAATSAVVAQYKGCAVALNATTTSTVNVRILDSVL